MIQLDCLYPFTKQECVMTDKKHVEKDDKPKDCPVPDEDLVRPNAAPGDGDSGPTSPPPPPPKKGF